MAVKTLAPFTRFILLLPLLVIICALHANAAQSGRIKGKVVAVTADKNEALPGVTVSLTGGNLQNRVVETVSDEEGEYVFDGLVAGDYVVTVELQGFEKYEHKVMVPIEASVDLNVMLNPLAPRETVTVETDDRESRKTESTVAGVVTTDTLRNAPLAREKYQEALPLLPGVVRGPDGMLALKGARAGQSGVLVSSLNATDPVTGISAIDLPLEAVELVQVYSNPYSSEYGKFTGAVTTIETRSGSNEFRYLLTNVLPRPRLRGGSIYGIGATTPRIAVGGPIKKDKLFFFQSFEYRFIRTQVESLPSAERDIRLESFDSFSRVDYNVNKSHRLAVSLSIFPQKIDGYNLNTFNPIETTANFHQRGWFFAVNEQATFAGGALLQSSLSAKQFDVDIYGNDAGPYLIAPERRFGGFFDRQARDSRRYEWLEVLNLPTRDWHGQHTPKFGVNISHTTFDGSDVSRPVQIVRADGTTSERIEFVGAGLLGRNNTEYSAFAQDKWTLGRHVTLDFGVRFDRDQVGRENNFAPRLGFVVSPFETARTILRGGLGLFYDKIPLGVGVFDQYQDFVVTTFAADGTTPVDGPRTSRTVVENNDFKNPYSVAWNLQLDQDITDKLLLRLGYEERRTRRDFVVEPVFGTGLLLLKNDGDARYREFQVAGRYRLQEKHQLFAAYVRSRATGDTNDVNTYFGNVRNPVIRPNEFTLQPYDAPHRLLFWGDIGLPKQVVASPVVDWRTGFPFSLVDEEQNFVGGRNQGGRFPAFFSLDLQVTKFLRVPVPDWKVIPAQFRGKKYGGRVGIKFFNLTSHWNPRDVQNNLDSPAFGTFYNSVGRSIRLKFEFVKF
ncbi:MAG TPA: carboxypeptidase regulatory-like domain-containing protein [Pyrinomonadaceae bacterium]|nr:carboxypeptidase regulatory-like domain-containing protein [Pyrinomonadaceae bacterium]